MRWFGALLLGLWLCQGAAAAQDLSVVARFDPASSTLAPAGEGAHISLALSQPVPWRVRLMADPPRLVLDVREVDWTGVHDLARPADVFADLRAGVFRPGWSRLVMELTGPFDIATAGMATDGGGARINLVLQAVDAARFADLAALPDPEGWALPKAADLPRIVPRGSGPLVVALDPGHGGIDPGAQSGGISEADLMLTFARELKEELLRDGRFLVVLTRDDDVFVPLEARVSITRAAGAHVLLSLHADALAEGDASGATLYSLSEEASDAAAAALAERHDRDDLLAGVDLTDQDDLVARVLMDMARNRTAPRVDRLGRALETSIKAEGLKMHRRARQAGGFSVLKSPDIPALLVELGFLSSRRDFDRLTDPEWRARMARALRDGLIVWAAEDAVLSGAVAP